MRTSKQVQATVRPDTSEPLRTQERRSSTWKVVRLKGTTKLYYFFFKVRRNFLEFMVTVPLLLFGDVLGDGVVVSAVVK